MKIELSRADALTELASLDGQMVASNTLRILNEHYGMYEWAVEVDEDGHVARIYNMTLAAPVVARDTPAYVIHPHKYATASEFKAKIIAVGGEWAERCNMPRRRWDGETLPTKIDGIKDKYQPILGADGRPIIF